MNGRTKRDQAGVGLNVSQNDCAVNNTAVVAAAANPICLLVSQMRTGHIQLTALNSCVNVCG